jgi:hypothetical protein
MGFRSSELAIQPKTKARLRMAVKLYPSDEGHCWHTGSGMDSASYSQTEIHSTTHYMCCHCGQTKTEVEHHKFSPIKDPARHGPHSWYTLRDKFNRMISHEPAKTESTRGPETKSTSQSG